MKTRSEWGSYEDWMAFVPQVVHEAVMNEELYKVSLHGLNIFHSAFIVEEARRAAVEDYCNKYDIPLPWRQDYDLSTVEGCEETIKECGYVVNSNILAGRVSVIQIEDAQHIKNVIFELTLAQWQEAAQFAIDNPA